MDLIDVVSSHHERAVVRVADVYVKVETDPDRASTERVALGAAPIPTPQLLWWHTGPPAVLALSAVRGEALARLGAPSPHPAAAWSAAGAAARRVHDTPAPEGLRSWFECAAVPGWIDGVGGWLRDNTAVEPAVIEARVSFAHAALDGRTTAPVFMHGDLQAEHVHIADGQVAGVVDWADAGLGDPLYDLATLTVGHREWLDDVLTGYGGDTDNAGREVIRGYWTLRRLWAVSWMIQHGFDASGDIAALAIDMSND